MRFLAVETSCDETSASIVESFENSVNVLSNTTSSSARLHATTGGIIPEQAAREQIKTIIPVITEALLSSEKISVKDTEDEFKIARKILEEKIDGFAVTIGPGLIGSLLVGVETVKALAFYYKKPLYPTNHLLGHLYANFLTENTKSAQQINFPFIGLIISGGHTDLLYFTSHTNYKWLGGTRDDAAGEALDKIGRMLGIAYPAGAEIEKRAQQSTNKTLRFQSPLLSDNTYDFSFSGLKTEVMRYTKNNIINENAINDICKAAQEAIIKVVVKKTIQALTEFDTNTLLIGGGVAANTLLREKVKDSAEHAHINLDLFAPEIKYCADNAAMIGARAILAEKPISWKTTKALPELYF